MKYNYFLQFWKGGNNFVQSILEFCVEWKQIWLFFSDCLCFSNANKINKPVNTKAFVIATIFWERLCIIWQKCRGANVFDHDCMSWVKRFLPESKVGFEPRPLTYLLEEHITTQLKINSSGSLVTVTSYKSLLSLHFTMLTSEFAELTLLHINCPICHSFAVTDKICKSYKNYSIVSWCDSCYNHREWTNGSNEQPIGMQQCIP